MLLNEPGQSRLPDSPFIRMAREIGTYEISIRPGHGCSIVPIHPVTEADPAKVAEMSAAVDIDALARASADAARLDSGA